MIWSLEELEEMILPGLGRLGDELQQKVIEIAKTNQPAIACDLVEATLCNCGYAPNETVAIARSASWLSVVYRDRRKEEFEQIIKKKASL